MPDIDRENQTPHQRIVHIDSITLANFFAPLGVFTGMLIFWFHRTNDSGDWSIVPTVLTLACELPIGVLLTWVLGGTIGVLINLSLMICGGIGIRLRIADPTMSTSVHEKKFLQYSAAKGRAFEQPANNG